MTEPRCGCCHATLWTGEEHTSGVCDECRAIARHPERYEGDPDVDVALVVRKVRSTLYARQSAFFAFRRQQTA